MAVVEVRHLTKRYGIKPVLEDVSFVARPGELFLIAGRSGSGKSTLLAVLAGLARPTSGAVVIGGRDVATLSPDETRLLRLHKIGIVFQDFRLIPDLTVAENVQLPLSLAGRRRQQEHVRDLLDRVGLTNKENDYPETLSGGEQQRAALARALANKPSVVLADEPTANLDEENARRVMRLLRAIADAGRTVVVASHDPLATPAATRKLSIVGGRLEPPRHVIQGPPVV